MSEYVATTSWRLGAKEDFLRGRYSRAHQWRFDGGAVVPASASPQVVTPPYALAANVDPEEALVAALSSCHMLFFLELAAKAKLVVREYNDQAVGYMGKNAEGKEALLRVVLRPRTLIAEPAPGRDELERLHRRAHELCYIANSVKAEVVTEL